MAEVWDGFDGGTSGSFGVSSGYRLTAVSFSKAFTVDAVRVDVAAAGTFRINIQNSSGTTIESSETFTSTATRAWVVYELTAPLAPGTYRVQLQWLTGSTTWYCATTESYSGSTAYGNTGSVIANRDYNMQVRQQATSPAKRWDGSAWVPLTIKYWNGSAWVVPTTLSITH